MQRPPAAPQPPLCSVHLLRMDAAGQIQPDFWPFFVGQTELVAWLETGGDMNLTAQYEHGEQAGRHGWVGLGWAASHPAAGRQIWAAADMLQRRAPAATRRAGCAPATTATLWATLELMQCGARRRGVTSRSSPSVPLRAALEACPTRTVKWAAGRQVFYVYLMIACLTLPHQSGTHLSAPHSITRHPAHPTHSAARLCSTDQPPRLLAAVRGAQPAAEAGDQHPSDGHLL